VIAALVASLCMLGPVPDNACTPGTYDPIPLAQVCTTKRRPGLSDYDRNLIVSSYGVPHWSGKDGELDHRVPFFEGGRTDSSNVWPQKGPLPNAKDRLEDYVFHRLCVLGPEGKYVPRKPATMKLSTARNLFRRDWRTASCRYHLPVPAGYRCRR
jgi:hypothetical protein